mmetsp:Transcript_41405/g.81665  ORF Transcript_41405/g.81665 Transcript_41405/m.81665 type:complete len:227 (-) Transcript_41405:948-1628(-)
MPSLVGPQSPAPHSMIGFQHHAARLQAQPLQEKKTSRTSVDLQVEEERETKTAMLHTQPGSSGGLPPGVSHSLPKAHQRPCLQGESSHLKSPVCWLIASDRRAWPQGCQMDLLLSLLHCGDDLGDILGSQIRCVTLCEPERGAGVSESLGQSARQALFPSVCLVLDSPEQKQKQKKLCDCRHQPVPRKSKEEGLCEIYRRGRVGKNEDLVVLDLSLSGCGNLPGGL